MDFTLWPDGRKLKQLRYRSIYLAYAAPLTLQHIQYISAGKIMDLAAFQESPCGEFQTRITDRPIPGPDEIVIEVNNALAILRRTKASSSMKS